MPFFADSHRYHPPKLRPPRCASSRLVTAVEASRAAVQRWTVRQHYITGELGFWRASDEIEGRAEGIDKVASRWPAECFKVVSRPLRVLCHWHYTCFENQVLVLMGRIPMDGIDEPPFSWSISLSLSAIHP